MNVETRAFDLESTGTEDPVLHGYAIRWNEVSQPLPFLERFLPGAFKDSLGTGHDVLALVDHDTGRVIGRRSNNTLQLEEDNKGLRVEIRPNTGTTWGRDIAALVERRDVTGMSIGFTAKEEEWDQRDGHQVRDVKSADLVEVSVTVNPAYAGANIDKRNLQEDDNVDVKERETRQTIDELERRQLELEGKAELSREEQVEYLGLGRELRTAKESLETPAPRPVLDVTARDPEKERLERRAAFNEYLRTGRIETRQQTLGDNAEGGFTSSEDFRSEVLRELADLSCMRQIARVLPPIHGTQAVFPRVASADAALMIEEGDPITARDIVFNQVTLVPSKCAALVNVSNELLKDTKIDFQGFLARYFAEAIAATLEAQYWNGNNVDANLQGILQAAVGLTRVTCTANNAVVLGDVLDLHNGLPAKYRANAVWVMHPDLEAELSEMVDGTGRPIIIGDWSQGLRRTLLGKPIYLSDEFPGVIGADNDIMAFGDFKRGVFIGDSANLDVQRNDSVGFASDLTAFRAVLRSDIAVANADAIRILELNS